MLGVLLVMTPPAVLRRVLHHETVTLQTIAGAVCVYVLLGLVFAFLYVAIGPFTPDAFSQRATGSGARGSATYLYFSFISLTTVGFGDIVPVGKVAAPWSCWRPCSARSSWSPPSPAWSPCSGGDSGGAALPPSRPPSAWRGWACRAAGRQAPPLAGYGQCHRVKGRSRLFQPADQRVCARRTG